MDRQAVLDQKRQRLRELRLRRALVSDPKQSSPEPKQNIDVAVQVDLLPKVSLPSVILPDANLEEPPGVFRFNKAVQTDSISAAEDDPILPESPEITQQNCAKPEPAAEEPVPVSVTETLTAQLAAWDLPFSDLRLGRRYNDEPSASSPFLSRSVLSSFLCRPVVSVVSSPHFPDLVLVAYGDASKEGSRPKTKIFGLNAFYPSTIVGSNLTSSLYHHPTLLAGLAVLYNTKSSVLVPEFFLQCASLITVVVFDRSDPAKVFAGLENGRVVMWDVSALVSTQIAVLPTLQTPSIVSKDSKAKIDVICHTSAVLYLGQPMWAGSQDATLVSVCSDGVVNVWSPNFLELPKISSVRVGLTSPRMSDQLFVSTALITRADLKEHSKTVAADTPELLFLDRALVGTQNGLVYRLSSSSETQYLGEKLFVPKKPETPQISEIVALVELNDLITNFLLSFHSDWSFRLWNTNVDTPLCTVPTSTAVNGVSVRPGHKYQFATFGDIRPPSARFCVEFWDLEVRLRSPVVVVPTKDVRSGTASFSDDGAILYVAYDNGDVDVWDIDEESLRLNSEQSKEPTVDKGLASVVQLSKPVET